MTAPVLSREFTSEEIGAAGVVDEMVTLDLAGKPGSALRFEEDSPIAGRFTATTTDPTEFQIYDRDGRAWRMPRLVALTRLKKRYPASDQRYPGQPVFMAQRPKDADGNEIVPPSPKVACPAKAEVGCRKQFATDLMADQHMRSRHRGTWTMREEQRQRDIQQAQIDATQKQTEAMTRLVERMEGGTRGRIPVIPNWPDQTDQLEPTAEEFELSTADPEPPTPTASTKRADMISWLKTKEYPLPEGWIRMSQPDVWEYVRPFTVGEA